MTVRSSKAELIELHEDTAQLSNVLAKALAICGDSKSPSIRWAADIEQKSVNIALKARALLAEWDWPDTDTKHKSKDECYGNTAGVEIKKVRNAVKISMPRLIHKNKNQKDDVSAYYDSFIRPPIEEYFKEHPYKGGAYVLIYEHHYQNIHAKAVRDHDNLETKAMTDILMRCIGVDDHPSFCSTFVQSREANDNRTVIFIVGREKFPAFLMQQDTKACAGSIQQ